MTLLTEVLKKLYPNGIHVNQYDEIEQVRRIVLAVPEIVEKCSAGLLGQLSKQLIELARGYQQAIDRSPASSETKIRLDEIVNVQAMVMDILGRKDPDAVVI